ncbi:MAG: hypothetical protein QOI31_3144 [Solirubrobacterales bacterium]|jgi:hypothetical protein|nr:hypothetical protein [Solirubrobacterales bacterium]
MHSTRKRRLIGGGITVAVLVAAGLAYAAWTASGTGSGTAKAGAAQALTTNAVAITAGDLYPGTNGDVKLEIVNPNPYPVQVTSVSNGSGSITAAGGIGTCTTTGVTYTNQTGLTINVPANGSQTATLDDAAHMSNASENGCQGATFTIPVSLTGASNAP